MPLRARAALIAVSVTLAGCTASGEREGARAQAVVLTADHLFDGDVLIRDAAIRIEGSEVVEVGSRSEVDTDAGRRIDLGDATILPGFIDLHVHLKGNIALAETILGTGVTTVRDVGSRTVIGPFDIPGELRILSAGPLISAPGGAATKWHRRITKVVDGVEDGRRLARRLISQEAALLKLYLATFPWRRYPLPSVAEVRAIVAEAHDAGIIVTAHVDDARGVRLALAGGVDELAHIPCVRISQALIDRLVENEVPVVATLHVEKQCFPYALKNAYRFVRAGGNLLYGSDLGNAGIPDGLDLRELQLMVKAGLTVEQAIEAATARAGEQLGLEPLGTLVPGAPADVFAVEGNPLAPNSLGLLEDRVLVMAGGEIVVQETATR